MEHIPTGYFPKDCSCKQIRKRRVDETEQTQHELWQWRWSMNMKPRSCGRTQRTLWRGGYITEFRMQSRLLMVLDEFWPGSFGSKNSPYAVCYFHSAYKHAYVSDTISLENSKWNLICWFVYWTESDVQQSTLRMYESGSWCIKKTGYSVDP